MALLLFYRGPLLGHSWGEICEHHGCNRCTDQVWRDGEERFFFCVSCVWLLRGPLITDRLLQLRKVADGCWKYRDLLFRVLFFLCYLKSSKRARGIASKASLGRICFTLFLNFCFVLIEISPNDESRSSKKGYSCWQILFSPWLLLVSCDCSHLECRLKWRCPYISEYLFPLRQQRNLRKSQQISHKHCSTTH